MTAKYYHELKSAQAPEGYMPSGPEPEFRIMMTATERGLRLCQRKPTHKLTTSAFGFTCGKID